MLNASRYCSGSGGRQPSAVMPSSSKDRQRIVNGCGSAVSGFVNRCEQVLDDKNEMVVTATQATVGHDDEYYQSDMCYKKFAVMNLQMIDNLTEQTAAMRSMISDKNNVIMKLTQDLEFVSGFVNVFFFLLLRVGAKSILAWFGVVH